jgi:hypothetical protein
MIGYLSVDVLVRLRGWDERESPSHCLAASLFCIDDLIFVQVLKHRNANQPDPIQAEAGEDARFKKSLGRG